MRSDEGMDVVAMLRSGCKRVLLVSMGGCWRRVWKRAVSGCVGAEGMCGVGEGAGMGWEIGVGGGCCVVMYKSSIRWSVSIRSSGCRRQEWQHAVKALR